MSDLEIEEIAEIKDLAIEQLLFRLKRHTENKQQITTLQKGQKVGSKEEMNLRPKNGTMGSGELSGGQSKLVRDLTDTVSVLQQKLAKMEQMMKVKDEKIKYLSNKLGQP